LLLDAGVMAELSRSQEMACSGAVTRRSRCGTWIKVHVADQADPAKPLINAT
jgi:hypothetical protein